MPPHSTPGAGGTIPAHVQSAVESVAKKNGFKKPRLDIRLASSAGDNYMSVMYRAEIAEGEEEDGTLSVMVKSTLPSPVARKTLKMHGMFYNEANYYNVIFSAYEDLMKEKGLLSEGECYPDAPRCYAASVGTQDEDDKHILILKDKRLEGFVMLDRKKAVDLAHCRLVMGALADLHACSLAMERLHPERFQTLRDSISDVLCEGEGVIAIFSEDKISSKALDMIEERYPKGTPEYEKMKQHCSIMQQDILELAAPRKQGGNVLTHGDCWINNMLFKYSATGAPERACLLDFQFCRYASPVLDLVYFLYVCTEKALRDAHLDSLLREYHSRLQARLRALGVRDPDAALSWELLQSHLRQCGRFGLQLAIAVVPLLFTTQEDVPDMSSGFEDDKSLFAAFSVMGGGKKEKDRRMADVLEEMIHRGYL